MLLPMSLTSPQHHLAAPAVAAGGAASSLPTNHQCCNLLSLAVTASAAAHALAAQAAGCAVCLWEVRWSFADMAARVPPCPPAKALKQERQQWQKLCAAADNDHAAACIGFAASAAALRPHFYCMVG
jgi:hypothetical protein